MTGKKYALFLGFLCWLSLILFNWLWLLGLVEYGTKQFVHLFVFVLIGFVAGSFALDTRNKND